jgi:two-component system NtrC family sensor kinase
MYCNDCRHRTHGNALLNLSDCERSTMNAAKEPPPPKIVAPCAGAHSAACPVQDLIRANDELKDLNQKLSSAQTLLTQSEKLASIGQLAAGVAHEINNPVGYVISNFESLRKYITQLFRILAAYERAEPLVGDVGTRAELTALREEVELDFLKEDIPALMAECREGIERVRKIVQDLKDFSRVDGRQEWEMADLHRGINSTLNIVNNEIKYKADVVREYGDLPDVECLPSEINQVVLNLLVNAAHAIGERRGVITIRTGRAGDEVSIQIADDGCGIAPENLARIFDPFFTTKPIGEGTGLGLSLSYGIVQKHHGRIDVWSEPGRGTKFTVHLPIKQPESLAQV